METTTATHCNLHLVKSCATCYKYASECDFGACRRAATMRVVAEVETRRCCDRHVKDIARYYPAARVEAR